MLTPPDGLGENAVAAVLGREWQLTVASMNYRPVGFGSYHWAVTEPGGARWFVSADDLATKSLSAGEPLDAAFARLRCALGAAAGLRAAGLDCVVAPVPTAAGEPLARAGQEFAVALYPFLDGTSFEWGAFDDPGHRGAMLDMVVAVHTAPAAVRRRALADDFTVPHLDELEVALGRAADQVPDHGPYARPAASLLSASAGPVRRLLGRYRDLVARAGSQAGRAVLTHGEPHPGNTMLTAAGWRLIDWDMALVALPERDLWSLDPGDGSVYAAYADATGVRPSAEALDLFRLRWDLSDLALDARRFRRPHSGTDDDEKTWQVLRALLTRISAG